MRNTTKIFILIILLFGKLFAQNNTSGVYYNSSDYKDGKLSLSLSCVSSSDKISLHHFFSGDRIDVIKDEKKYTFSKDSIFGYRDCKQDDYRFYKEDDKEYKILENKTLVIYIADVAVTSANGKARELVPSYFFSTALNSAILPLTVQNIKNALQCNNKLACMIDKEFGNGNEISIFDVENKMYRVNYILSKQSNN